MLLKIENFCLNIITKLQQTIYCIVYLFAFEGHYNTLQCKISFFEHSVYNMENKNREKQTTK